MMISLTQQDFATLSPRTQSEIMSLWDGSASESAPASVVDKSAYNSFDMVGVVDLTHKEVREWMKAASDKIKAGLRAVAEHGPLVDIARVTDAGIDNLSHFQSRVTIRTRTITGDDNAYLLGYDEWEKDASGKYVKGRYAVSPLTYRSLRTYFGLDG